MDGPRIVGGQFVQPFGFDAPRQVHRSPHAAP
jgi:hypothetical protein